MRWIIFALVVSASASFGAEVIRLPLNPNEPVVVPIGSSEPTTISFPSAVTGIIPGAKMARAGAQAVMGTFSLIFDHPQNSNLLVVRGVAPKAQSNVTILLKKKAYLLKLVCTDEPAYLVIMSNAVETGAPKATRISKPLPQPKFDERIGMGLLDRARAYRFMIDQAPELYKDVEAVFPNTITDYGNVKIKLCEAYRFATEDATIFRLEITNYGNERMYISPASLAARAGQNVYHQSIARCPDELPPGKVVQADFAVIGTPDGTRNDLSVKNSFTIQANIQKEMFPVLDDLPNLEEMSLFPQPSKPAPLLEE